jgi:hypothetical protein
VRRRLLLLIALALLFVPAVARASSTQESFFQDDDHLIYASDSMVRHTLSTLAGLGVERLRITVKWSAIAPAATSRTRPSHFKATDAAAYGSAVWAPYDRIVRLAPQYGIGVDFNITAPGPLWAMRHDSPTTRAADHWAPNPRDFYNFVYAVGRRYSGTYGGIPAVSMWSIWNEPNQPGWLAPQSRTVGRTQVPNSPRLYRLYLQSAMSALGSSGHTVSHDTILIGELAPEGYEAPGFYTAITPLPFLRALYCVDRSYHRLRGTAATALGCPTNGSTKDFVAANSGLFYANGFAHHPYYFFHSPWFNASDPNFVPMGDLGRLERALDRAVATYGVHKQMPIYLTEYGYQTNPPDPYETVTPRTQAEYLNAADYIAYRDPRVRSVGQFLLYDSGPDPRFTPNEFGYWDTFQTGLAFAGGQAKPAMYAYRLPIWIPGTHVRPGQSMLVWGQLRMAPNGVRERASIQWRGSRGGGYRTIATVTTTNVRGYLTARVRPPGSGTVRIAWRVPGGGLAVSRAVGVSVR